MTIDEQRAIDLLNTLSPESRMRVVAAVEDDPAEVAAAWETEIGSRIEDIKSGKIEGIPADEVHARLGIDGS